MSLTYGTARDFEMPADDEHTLIVGRNGTGKTQHGFWHLSKQDLAAKPWYFVDFKGEGMLDGITRARHIDYKETPDQPGFYILHATPFEEDEEALEGWMRRVWNEERRGVFFDEAYMLPRVDKGAYAAMLTQGRSKRLSLISLSQRPVRVNRAAISEASHIIAFDLNDKRDHKSLEEVVPTGFMKDELPKWHSRWYSVKKDLIWSIKPVPEAAQIIDDINSQLPPLKRWL